MEDGKITQMPASHKKEGSGHKKNQRGTAGSKDGTTAIWLYIPYCFESVDLIFFVAFFGAVFLTVAVFLLFTAVFLTALTLAVFLAAAVFLTGKLITWSGLASCKRIV